MTSIMLLLEDKSFLKYIFYKYFIYLEHGLHIAKINL